MKSILASASKLVLLFITFTSCIAFAFRILESKDFMVLAVMVFTYYFSTKRPQVEQKPDEQKP